MRQLVDLGLLRNFTSLTTLSTREHPHPLTGQNFPPFLFSRFAQHLSRTRVTHC